jgi:membrane fusion protein, multidrug efflux system
MQYAINVLVGYKHMITKINKKWRTILLAVGISIIAYRYFTSSNHGPAFAQIAPQVSVAEVVQAHVQQWEEFSGRLVATDVVEIHPRVSGMIESIHFKNGAIVNKGDLLFTLDQRPYQEEVKKAEGMLASEHARVVLAKAELERAEQLIKDKVISMSEYDSRKNNYAVLQANLKSAEAHLNTAKLNAEYTKIRAPITGRISRAEMTVGNLVNVGAQSIVLATIVSHTPIYADFEVDEKTFLRYAKMKSTELNNVKQIPILMALATDEEASRKGHIESFDNHLNITSGTIRVRAIFDNPDMVLVPGLFARIKLGSPTKTHSILITDRAISTDQNKKYVLVIDNENTVHYREVKLGAMADGLRIIKEGLQSGEKVVLNGLQQTRPGQKVTPEIVPMPV